MTDQPETAESYDRVAAEYARRIADELEHKPDVEHPSQRAYIFARKPVGSAQPERQSEQVIDRSIVD